MNIDNTSITAALELFANKEYEAFRSVFVELHPYDQSDLFMELNEEERAIFYTIIPSEEVAELFTYITHHDEIEEIFDKMDNDYASDILSEMSSDDAADILQKLDKDEASNYLEIMDDEDQADILELLHYEEYTAGSIMTNDYIELNEMDSVKVAMKKMISGASEAETIYTLYVVDDEGLLAGVLSLKELITAKGEEIVKDIMTTDIISVNVMDDQEDVAKTIQDYDFLALPVVDKGNHLLGIVTVDDLIDVALEEASEDYSLFAAISDAEIDVETETVFRSVRKRLPWLVILLFVGLVTSTIMDLFTSTLDRVSNLELFIPLILGMAGNTGTQALAVTLRGIATEEFENSKDVGIHLFREMQIGLMNGVLMGSLTFAFSHYLMGQTPLIALLLSVAILVSLTVATLAGAVIPLVIETFGIDPAVASGPFITTINDILAVTIYLGLATLFIELLI